MCTQSAWNHYAVKVSAGSRKRHGGDSEAPGSWDSSMVEYWSRLRWRIASRFPHNLTEATPESNKVSKNSLYWHVIRTDSDLALTTCNRGAGTDLFTINRNRRPSRNTAFFSHATYETLQPMAKQNERPGEGFAVHDQHGQFSDRFHLAVQHMINL